MTPCCLNTTLGILAITGPDAATFLQGQATCDVRLVTPGLGALGALCNLQGRMIVSFYVLHADDGLHLVMPGDRVDAVLQHLKKYAVFSKVTLHDASAAWTLIGICGDDAAYAAPTAGDIFSVTRRDDARILRLNGTQRFLQLVPADTAAGGTADSPADIARWTQHAIAAGELLIDTANADRFLPQALNYDLINGVSFKKGCYTGQEVVARMHFKGKMKERLCIANFDAAVGDAAAPSANTPIVNADGKNVGEVVAATAVDGRCTLGAVIRHDAVQAGGLHVGATDGPVIGVLPLPYAVDDA